MPKGQVLNMYNTVSAAPRGPHQLPVRRLWSNLDCNTKGRNLIIIRWLYFLRGLMSARIAAAIKTQGRSNSPLQKCWFRQSWLLLWNINWASANFDILLQFQQFLREVIFNGNRPLLQKGHTEEIYEPRSIKAIALTTIKSFRILWIKVKLCREYLLAAPHPFINNISLKLTKCNLTHKHLAAYYIWGGLSLNLHERLAWPIEKEMNL